MKLNTTKLTRPLMARFPIAGKLLIVFLVLLVVPTFVVTFFSYRSLQVEISRKVRIARESNVREMAASVSEVFDLALSFSSYLAVNQTVRSVLKLDLEQANDYAKFRALYDIEGAINSFNTPFLSAPISVLVFDLDGPVYRSGDIQLYRDYAGLRLEPWFTETATSKRELVHVLGVTRDFVTGEIGKHRYSLARSIRNENGTSSVGVAVVSVDTSGILWRLPASSSYGESLAYVHDATGTIIASTETRAIGGSESDLWDSVGAETEHEWELMRMPLATRLGDLRFVEAVAAESLLIETRRWQTWYLIIIGMLLSLYFVFFFLVIMDIVRRIQHLATATLAVSGGDLSTRVDDEHKDELAVLADGFNTMVLQLSGLIDRVKLEQEEKREAELRMLESQIRPHFLFNALNSIKTAASMSRAENVAVMIGALASLMAEAFRHEREFIPLLKEIENVKNYVLLQNLRFSNKFTLELDITEPVEMVRVPKFILQPIVENSILHGYRNARGRCAITIRGYQTDRSVTVLVQDHGSGIEPSHVDPLPEPREGVGLLNVRKRIKLHFGEEAQLSIRPRTGGGAEVELRFPVNASDQVESR